MYEALRGTNNILIKHDINRRKKNSSRFKRRFKERLAIQIKQIVEKNGASFAFPSQSIYVEKK